MGYGSCAGIKSFFFFKQKTAYEFGLGIPAEPLFRSKKRPACCKIRGLMVTVCPSQFATRRTLFHVLVGCEIGRASCRERVEVSVVGVASKREECGEKEAERVAGQESEEG